jgi:hypothetical protein
MTSYTVRVELHNADEDDYASLTRRWRTKVSSATS